MHRILASIVAAFAALAGPAADAQTCSGFDDVPFGSAFCPNVDWLKNRGITLGCTSATLYCPGEPVTRLSMAAFMNRLGNALAPKVLRVEQTGGATSLATGAILCETTVENIQDFPRTFSLNGYLTVQGAPNGDAQVIPVMRTNGGAYGGLNQTNVPVSLRSPSPWMSVPIVATPQVGVRLEVGNTYQFAIQVSRLGSSSDLTAYFCQLAVEIRNRQGDTFPY